jgi:hypothetical protein
MKKPNISHLNTEGFRIILHPYHFVRLFIVQRFVSNYHLFLPPLFTVLDLGLRLDFGFAFSLYLRVYFLYIYR